VSLLKVSRIAVVAVVIAVVVKGPLVVWRWVGERITTHFVSFLYDCRCE
jgi:hypothetical protein